MNLRVSNIVMTGKLPFKRKLNDNEIKNLVMKANYFAINEENSLILQKKIPKLERGISVHNRQKGWCISLWTSGAINLVGLLKQKEGIECYNLALNDIRKYCRGVLDD